jgi:hypothetical protein
VALTRTSHERRVEQSESYRPAMGPKRRLGVDPSNIIDGDARGKRRKEADTPYPPESSSPAAEADAAAEAEELGQDMVQLDPTQIRDHGLQIWNAVKDTRGKESALPSSFVS